MKLVPLGDQAVLIYFPDEAAALHFAAALGNAPPAWLVDVVPAYTSVAIFFDLDQTRFAEAADFLRDFAATAEHQRAREESRRHRIPCCYELALDMHRLEEQTGLSREQIITQHSATEYIVYAIGFCPGFPYLGYLPPALAGVPRLPSPRLQVEAGSVGLTGRQTGIYTEARPGGWHIIGRTPLQLVDVTDGYFPLRTGDHVRFEPIDEAAFQRLLGQRLPVSRLSSATMTE
jgi:inhibitor of KinA